MARKIWKYENYVGAITTTPHLGNAPVIHVAPDLAGRSIVSFWIEWEDSRLTHGLPWPERRFTVVGTGHEIPDNYRYCGTAVFDNAFVWHLYEIF